AVGAGGTGRHSLRPQGCRPALRACILFRGRAPDAVECEVVSRGRPADASQVGEPRRVSSCQTTAAPVRCRAVKPIAGKERRGWPRWLVCAVSLIALAGASSACGRKGDAPDERAASRRASVVSLTASVDVPAWALEQEAPLIATEWLEL